MAANISHSRGDGDDDDCSSTEGDSQSTETFGKVQNVLDRPEAVRLTSPRFNIGGLRPRRGATCLRQRVRCNFQGDRGCYWPHVCELVWTSAMDPRNDIVKPAHMSRFVLKGKENWQIWKTDVLLWANHQKVTGLLSGTQSRPVLEDNADDARFQEFQNQLEEYDSRQSGDALLNAGRNLEPSSGTVREPYIDRHHKPSRAFSLNPPKTPSQQQGSHMTTMRWRSIFWSGSQRQ